MNRAGRSQRPAKNNQVSPVKAYIDGAEAGKAKVASNEDEIAPTTTMNRAGRSEGPAKTNQVSPSKTDGAEAGQAEQAEVSANEDETAPTKSSPWMSSTAVTVLLPSVMACILVQVVAAFFQTCSQQTFDGALDNQRDFTSNGTRDKNNLYIIYNLFSAFAGAMSWPLVQNYGYSPLFFAGAGLFLFSSVASSTVSLARVLLLPYSIYGAIAYSLTSTVGQIAILDILGTQRQQLAAILSFLGVAIGQLAGSLTFGFSKMSDDANYDGDKAARWPNNLRAIDVTVLGIVLAATVIRPPSLATGKWPEVFKNIAFYLICLCNFFVSMGFDLIEACYTETPTERDFDTFPPGTSAVLSASFFAVLAELVTVTVFFVLDFIGRTQSEGGFSFHKEAFLTSSIIVSILSFFTYIHEPLYQNVFSLLVYGIGAGIVKGVVRTFLPLAMLSYVGPHNLTITLPFLIFSGGLGALISYSYQYGADIPDSESIDSAWYTAAGVFSIFSIVSLYVFFGFETQNLDGTTSAAGGTGAGGEGDAPEALENADFVPAEDAIPGISTDIGAVAIDEMV